jgi:hypothetical protein
MTRLTKGGLTDEECFAIADAKIKTAFPQIEWHLVVQPPGGLPGQVGSGSIRDHLVAIMRLMVEEPDKHGDFPQNTSLILTRRILLEEVHKDGVKHTLRDHSAEFVFLFDNGRWRSVYGG